MRRCLSLLLLLLAAGWAALPAAAAPPVVPDTLAQRLLACTGCHGPQGRAARDGYYPRIAGKPADYLFHQLQGFRDGRRQYALMTGLLDPLSDAYLREIAEHFASLDVPYAPVPPQPALPAAVAQRGAQLVREGDAARRLPACMQCHGSALTGVAPAIPGLLGLPRDYLVAQLGAWRTGQRKAVAPDCMAQVAEKLTPEEIGAVASWLAAQPVPQPAHPAAALPAPLPMDCGGVPGGVAR